MRDALANRQLPLLRRPVAAKASLRQFLLVVRLPAAENIHNRQHGHAHSGRRKDRRRLSYDSLHILHGLADLQPSYLPLADMEAVMTKNLMVSITYSRNEKRWIVATSGTQRDNMNMNYECKSREAALILIADLFEMNI